jgi:hypothetical protein
MCLVLVWDVVGHNIDLMIYGILAGQRLAIGEDPNQFFSSVD